MSILVGVELSDGFNLAIITGFELETVPSGTVYRVYMEYDTSDGKKSTSMLLPDFVKIWDYKVYVPEGEVTLRGHVEAVLATEFQHWIDWDNLISPLADVPIGQFVYHYEGGAGGVTLAPDIVTDPELNSKVLEINVQVPPDSEGYAWLGFALWRMQNLSDVKYLVLDIKADRPLSDKQLKIELNRVPRHPLESEDIKNWIYLPEDVSIDTDWQRLYIPVPDNLSTNIINAIVFTFEAWRGAETGTIWIDKVGFAQEKE